MPEAAGRLKQLKTLLAEGQLQQAQLLASEWWQSQARLDWALAWARLLSRPQPDLASDWYQKILLGWPEHQPALRGLAELALAQRQFKVALAYWQKLVQLNPSAEHLNNLAAVALEAAEPELAEQSFKQALVRRPDLWQAAYQLGSLLLRLRPAEALDYFRQCLGPLPASQINPLCRLLYDKALALIQQRQISLAQAYLAFCCELPTYLPAGNALSIPLAEIYAARASCLSYSGTQAEVQQCYAQAIRLSDTPLAYRWAQLNALPFIYQSQAELLACREGFWQQLESFREDVLAGISPEQFRALGSVARLPFLLAYQGFNDRELVKSLGQLWSELYRQQGQWLNLAQPLRSKGPIRVGFVSSCFYHHSVTLCFHEAITRLAASEDFEVSCLYLGSRQDHWTEHLRQRVQYFVQLPGQLRAEDLRPLQQDVLIYTDIGMDSRAYQLALHRLAPIQCVLPGHPVTTGLPEMDYYLSGSLSEPEYTLAQSHYTEQLVLIADDLARFSPVSAPQRILSRAELGLPEAKHLYFCPMTLFKFHPDFDQALAEILRRDSQAIIYLARYYQTDLHRLLQERFERLLPDVAGRIRFVPWLDQQALYSLILQADAVLDSFHFGGGSTSRMVLGLGQPYVSWPAEFLRGRISYGCYRRMGLEDRLPDSFEAYVSEALRLGTDADYRQQRQQEIAARAQRLFEFAPVAGELADFLRRVVKG